MFVRHTRAAIALLAFVLSPATGFAETTSDSLDIAVYLGQSNDRINRASSGAGNGTGMASGFSAGFRLEVPIKVWSGRDASSFGALHAYGAMILSRRAYEDSSEAGLDPTSSATALLRTADAGEFYIGLRPVFFYGGDASERPGQAAYLRLELGGIAASEGNGDLIDMSFYGAGWERTTGRWQNSYLECGGGRSDVFARDSRGRRFKGRMGIEYSLSPVGDDRSLSSIFVQARVDTDFKSGPDGVRLLYGLRLDAQNVMGKLASLVTGAK